MIEPSSNLPNSQPLCPEVIQEKLPIDRGFVVSDQPDPGRESGRVPDEESAAASGYTPQELEKLFMALA